MSKKKSYITITDQFCGAGGSSQGARNYSRRTGGGVEVKLALNHWKLAIETHSANFVNTDHDCTDISASDPRRYVSTDILITSPECTNHSLAKGQKIVKAQLDLFDKGILDPAAERSRATMWDVCRFAEYHSYNIIIVENVVDARKWVMWESWLMAMDALGYFHKCCYFNSMHFHPTPQSRDRMYVVFWKKGNKAPNLEYQPSAHCSDCGKDVGAIQRFKKNPFGKFKTQYVYCCPKHGKEVTPYYFAAFNAIDWSDIGKKIGDRKKALSENTVRRIQYGLDKYSNEPFQVVNYSPGYCKPVTDASATITAQDHHGILTPFVVNDQHSTGIDCRVKSVNENLSTISTVPHLKLLTPFVVNCGHAADKDTGKTSKIMDSIRTQTTRQEMALVMPQLVEMNRTGKSKPISRPISTLTASSTKHWLLSPPVVAIARGKSNASGITDPLTTQSQMINHGIVTTEAWNSFINYYYGSFQSSHITDPLGTVSTKDRFQLLTYQQPKLEDCFYRMIKPPEVKAAMAFDQGYIILGSGKDQVKQCGNAVTPPVMEWLVQQCVESLAA